MEKKKNVSYLNENGNEANTYDIKITAHSKVHLIFTHQSILFFFTYNLCVTTFL